MRSLTLVLVFLVGQVVGCGGRSLGGDRVSDGGVVGEDAGLTLPSACEPMDVWGCPDGCIDEVGSYWDGAFCSPIICCCEGPDCAQTYATHADCVAAHLACMDEVCIDAGGYCASGSGWSGGCAVGHHENDALASVNPGLCGGGVCCTPCLEPDALEIDYIASSPEACADIDWDCFSPGWVNFENACGCGCARVQ